MIAAPPLDYPGGWYARQRPAAPRAWMALAALVAVEALLCLATRLRLPALTSAGSLAAYPLVIAVALRHRWPGNRLSDTLEFLALFCLLAPAVAALSYLCALPAAPFRDAAFDRIDRALGLDWVGYFHWVMARHWLAELYVRIYAQLVPQVAAIALICGLAGRRDRLDELFWGALAGGVITCLVSAVLPAAGPAVLHGAYLPPYWSSLQAVREGARTILVPQGIIQFPSFHTFIAVLYPYVTRRLGAIGWAFALFNLAMLTTIAPAGSHYFSDEIAGALIALAVIAWLRRQPRPIA